MKYKQILLDMDGVLCSFITSALAKLNNKLDKNITLEQYINLNQFNIEKVYNISLPEFWKIIEKDDDFWINLKPFPWTGQLIDELEKYAPVTICSSPSNNPICYKQKIEWLKYHVGIETKNIMLGSKKWLLAKPDHLLIDDLDKNVHQFILHGGNATLVPSDWNTIDLTFDKVWNKIKPNLIT